MLYIEKGPEPARLRQAKREGLKHYDDMTTGVKDEIRLHLATEQGFLCAYCMRKLRLETMQIEHYEAQHTQDGSYDPASTIDYQNMLGVCPGNKGVNVRHSHLTCDQHRGNAKLTVDPRKQRSVSLVKYRHDGVIYSDDDDVNRDLQETLNLNCATAYLPENRKAALDGLKEKIFRECAGKTASADYFRKLSDSLSRGNNGILPEYLGILLDYLKKRIHRTAT